MSSVVLLTGKISPLVGVPFLKVVDPEIRYKQYIESIVFYIQKTKIENIVFCENSEYPIKDKAFLDELAHSYNKNLEILQYQSNDEKTLKKGRGYGENEIIEYAIDHSKILQDNPCFFKITGRYIVKNIDIIAKTSLGKTNIFFRDAYVRPNLSFVNNKVNTAFFKTTISFFQDHLWGAGELVDEKKGICLEDVYMQRLAGVRNSIGRFSALPIFAGIGGGGAKINDSRLKVIIKKLLFLLGCNTI